MKVYVDELPNNCINCPCYDYECACCNVADVVLCTTDNFSRYEQRHKNCPLQSIADYTKQVRKEVCEEIRQKIKDNIGVVLGDYNYYTLKYNETEVCKIDIINDILDQIQEDG